MKKNNCGMHGARLVVTNAIASAMLLVYGRSAYAGTCVETPVASGNWVCSGAAGADTTGNISGAPVAINTTPGFGITVALGNALQISGSGVIFTDTNASNIFGSSSGASSGIWATNGFSGNLSITTNGTVSGNDTGIRAENSNTNNGSIVINTTGTVTANGTAGIYARNNFGTSNLSINAADVIGNQFGIHALNLGIGTTTINTTSTVTGTNNSGIYARIGGTDLNITTGDVNGGQSGIVAFNYGVGATNITSTGTVTGTNNAGIHVVHSGTDLAVTTAEVYGNDNGILVRNYGSGLTTINATGTVVGNYNGIFSVTNNQSIGMAINAVDVIGSEIGIETRNNGLGSTTITSTGTVIGARYYGINAHNSASAADLTITSANVSGGHYGIFARNFGIGLTTISSSGTVSGSYNTGISAFNFGTDLVVTTVDVDGGISGLDVHNYGTGATTVISTGTITGVRGNGILARNNLGTTDLTIAATNIIGDGYGVRAISYGSGSTNITSVGTVLGTDHTGIRARVTGTGLTISAANVAGGLIGISASNYGYGNTTITTTGTVTGASQFGIYARNNIYGADLTITTADVNGGWSGIYVHEFGSGATDITSSGVVTGTTTDGIYALTRGSSLTITASDVSGGRTGIAAVHQGNGPTVLSVSGNINGGIGVGIDTTTLSNNLTTINLASTAVVGATSNNAIANNLGNSVLNVAAGAIINGAIQLGNGSDTVNIAGVNAFNGITLLDGGDDVTLSDGFIDILNLNSAWTGNLNGANILNWEFVNINGGTLGFSNAAITAGQINVNNFGSLNGTNNLNITGNAAVASGSTIIAGNATGTNIMNIGGNLFNAGSVRLCGSTSQQAVGDSLTVTGNYIGSGGALVLDTTLNDDTSLTDRLLVLGNASGSTGIIVNNIDGLGAMTTGDGIMLVDVVGSSTANAFNLNAPVIAGAFNYRLYQNGIINPADGDWYLRSSARGITSPAIAVADIGNKLSLSMLGGLHDRLGEQEDSRVWIRVVGSANRQTHQSNIGDFEERNDSNFMQVGADLYRSENIRWGVFAAKTQNTAHMFDTSVVLDVEAGRAKVDGFAAGAYATHYTKTYYWDAVIQQSWLTAKASGDGDSFETDSKNWLASFEFGRGFAFGNKNTLQPQVQVIVGKSSIDDAGDSFTSYNYDDEDVLIGRMGIRWTRANDEVSAKGRFMPYLKANIWHNFSGDSLVNIGGLDIRTKRNDAWADVGLGFSIPTQNDWSIFMQYDFEKSIGQSDYENHTGTLGLRRNW